MMKAALCFDGVDDETLANGAAPLLARFDAVEAWCAYGDAAEQLVEHVRERHHGPPHPHHPPHHHASLDEEQARAIAANGVALLSRHGIAASPRALGGANAERAIAAASDRDIVILLSAGHRGGTGPHSIGHVARFVVDHARGPILVVRSR
jgi:nucleotide-binding universal stress UspA family protein